jgi:hypothetical protein
VGFLVGLMMLAMLIPRSPARSVEGCHDYPFVKFKLNLSYDILLGQGVSYLKVALNKPE